MTTHLDIYRQATSGTDEPWDRLDAIQQLRRRLDDEQGIAVVQMVQGGASWAVVATHLGVSRQAAWDRYRRLVDDPPSYSRSFGRLVVSPNLDSGS